MIFVRAMQIVGFVRCCSKRLIFKLRNPERDYVFDAELTRAASVFFTLFFGGKVPIRREAAKFFYTLFYTFRRKTKNRVLHHFFPLFFAAQREHFQFFL